MLYTVHEDGKITQSNKLYSFNEKDYDSRLRDIGYEFIKEQVDTLADPETEYIFRGSRSERPKMPIRLNRKRIKAGGRDAALLLGIPRKATVRVFAIGEMLHELTDINELELTIPVPCTYVVTAMLFPYRDYSVTIEAVQ